MTPFLKPVPGLEFYPEVHGYRLDGEWLPWSVTQVLSYDMPAYKKRIIEATKDGPDGWLARGTRIHECLEHKLLTGEQLADKKWAAWLEPLYDCDLFKGAETLAAEYVMCDKIKRVGGTADFILRIPSQNGSADRVVLGDLKTVSRTDRVHDRELPIAQLQAYRSFLAVHAPFLNVTDLVTVVCGPDLTEVRSQDPDGWLEWDEAFGKFQACHSDF